MASLRITKESSFWLLLAVVLVVNVVFMPRDMYPGDPVTMREETRAMLLHGELAVEDVVAKAYGDNGQFVVVNPRNGRAYSKYGSMSAMMYLVPMALEKLVEGDLPPMNSPNRVVYLNLFNLVMSLIAAALIYKTARRLGGAPNVAALYVGLAFYATFAWTYLRAHNSEIIQLVFFAWAVSAYLDLVDARRAGVAKSTAKLWLACGALLLTKISFVFVGPLFALGLAAERRQREGGTWSEAILAEAKFHVGPGLVPYVAMALLNTIKFGAPWLTGYHVWRPEIHGLGGDAFDALYELLFTSQFGLAFSFPLLFLALPWMCGRFRAMRYEYGVVAGIGIFYILLMSKLPSWRGEMCYGPRYFLFLLPFLSLPAMDGLAWLMSLRGNKLILPLAFIGGFLLHSTRLQFEVVRRPWFSFYQMRGPLDNGMHVLAALYFSHNSYGRVLMDFDRHQDALDEMNWWKEAKTVIPPEMARAYEAQTKETINQRNLYWFGL